jgi:mannose-6-phosphate isomerase
LSAASRKRAAWAAKNLEQKNMTPLYPLQFNPLFKRYLWGGRRLETVLGKHLGDGADYAESWELADHHAGQSIVAAGPLAGTSLGTLVRERGPELLGRHAPAVLAGEPRFPLLFKFLDSQRDLSVQVHPDDLAAARLVPPDLGKTEAWVIVAAEPGSRVYAGLRSGIDRQQLADATAAGRTAECLHAFEPDIGDCIFIPAGTVHALGAGLVVAEIQQASDTTYRLFDWNRVGPDGQPRALHIEQALAAIDYSAGPVTPVVPQATDRPEVQRLVACDKFVLDRWTISDVASLGGDGRVHIVTVLEGVLALDSTAGELALDAENGRIRLTRGQTVVLPACLPATSASPATKCALLDAYLP